MRVGRLSAFRKCFWIFNAIIVSSSFGASIANACDESLIISAISKESERKGNRRVDPDKAVKLLVRRSIFSNRPIGDIANCDFQFDRKYVVKELFTGAEYPWNIKYSVHSTLDNICISAYSYISSSYRRQHSNLPEPFIGDQQTRTELGCFKFKM